MIQLCLRVAKGSQTLVDEPNDRFGLVWHGIEVICDHNAAQTEDSKQTPEIQFLPFPPSPFLACTNHSVRLGFQSWNEILAQTWMLLDISDLKKKKKKVLITCIHKHSLGLVSIMSGLVHLHTFYYRNKIAI